MYPEVADGLGPSTSDTSMLHSMKGIAAFDATTFYQKFWTQLLVKYLRVIKK